MNLRFLASLLISVFCLFSLPLSAQDKVTVTGTVTSADDGQPLPGAAIVADSSNASVTDIDGKYSIEVSAGTELTISCLGFFQITFSVPYGEDNLVRNFSMKSEAQALDDVVVVAYGTKKKGTITGSVSTVKSDKMKDVPAASFDQALQGSTPGLSVMSQSGEPGAAAVFKIRGTNSINSGTAPLFILDGIPITSEAFSAISPSDIESISVLKDASSTSIYGARAANGVIVITSKRGIKAEKAAITFRTQLGMSNMAHGKWNMMNTAERIAYEQEVGLDEGQDYSKLALIDYNWLDEVFRQNAFLQNYELQINGATDKINYYVSGGYFDQEGISTDSDFKRMSVRTNLSFQANDWLRFGTNTMIAYENSAQSNYGSYALYAPISAASFMMPYWSPYKDDGSYASSNDGTWAGLNVNPLEWAEMNPYVSDKYKTISTLFAEITPCKGLTIRSNGGVDYSHGSVYTVSYPSYKPNNGKGSAARQSTDSYTFTISNTVSYMFDVAGKHDFNFMLGQEGVFSHNEGMTITTSGQSNDQLSDIAFGTLARSWDSSVSEYSFLSFFGRGEYNYDNRYFADLSIRGDGSSRFGKEGRWAAFWSVGFLWNLRNEDFLKDVSWLTNLQFNVSTGTSGNSSIPNYDHLALVGGGIEYDGISAIAPMSKGNEKLEWEKLMTTNVAIHAGFWNRLAVDAEFYNKKTSNMLMSVPVSYTDGGFGFRWDNVGGMVNRGVELQVSGDIISNKDFKWNVNANFSYNHNEITELYNGLNEYVVSTTGTKLVVGHSYGEFYLNRYAGVNSSDGTQLWYDKDGNLTSEFREEDKVMVGKSYISPWEGGFGTSFSWKGLSLTAQFSYVGDRWMINNDRYFTENGQLDSYNQTKRMLYDRWKKPGDITDIPRHGETIQFDTHLLEDASFLRLKNLMISYNLPADLLAKTKFFTGARVYAQGQNLLTLTGFSGLDPETSANIYKAQYPMTKQYTFGLELTF